MAEKKLNKRESEQLIEEARADVKHNIVKNIKCNPSYAVRRFVDRDILDKTVIHQYARFKKGMRKAEYNDEAVNKMRHTQTFDGTHLKICDVPLNMSVEEAYLNMFGTGIDGRASPTAMHQAYFCPKCHCKYVGDLACQDLKCPVCGTITPIGRLVQAKAYKKW